MAFKSEVCKYTITNKTNWILMLRLHKDNFRLKRLCNSFKDSINAYVHFQEQMAKCHDKNLLDCECLYVTCTNYRYSWWYES